MNVHQNQMNDHRNQMNGHQNQKRIGRIAADFNEWLSKSEAIGPNNHLQTLFQTHSNILSNCNWFR